MCAEEYCNKDSSRGQWVELMEQIKWVQGFGLRLSVFSPLQHRKIFCEPDVETKILQCAYMRKIERKRMLFNVETVPLVGTLKDD